MAIKDAKIFLISRSTGEIWFYYFQRNNNGPNDSPSDRSLSHTLTLSAFIYIFFVAISDEFIVLYVFP